MAKAPHPIDIEVGNRIKARRRMMGMSQGTLADALGVTFQQVQKYEKGTNRVSASRLQKVGEVLGVPVSSFFPNQPEEQEADSEGPFGEISRFIETNEGRDLNIAFAQIGSPSLRQRIVGLVKALAEP
ncbi:MAG: helix-turn-helix domain-containing protein [Alphaproteobacteria bacterium]|nr:helix-turn-helix domain-containing protein [Alphaproteobacteria bacterium]MBU2229962.1 helix-turn-helix domain-containing protein [Alphaproteobacteria bacterium]